MAPLGSRLIAAALDSVAVAASALIFKGMAASALPDYPLQIQWLSGLSIFCSASLFLFADRGRPFVLAVCSFKTILFGVILICLPVIDLRALPMIVSFTVVLAIFEETTVMVALSGLSLLFVLIAVSVFPTIDFSHRVAVAETALLAVLAAFMIGCSVAARALYQKYRARGALIERLRGDIGRIVDANIGFQEYSSLVEAQTLRIERDRLSREIHDSAGYALTTLKMAFEAARGIREREPERLDGLLGDGARLAEEALGEIRRAMRDLRSQPEGMPEGLAFVVRLVRNFEAVTKIGVDIDFSNSRGSYGKGVDPLVYKMVQEGLINAYRHGHATRVGMTFREAEGELQIRIKDNGASPKKLVKGLGLQGMEERIAEAGGTIDFVAGEGGFTIVASIPLGG
jgi:signal transduction histidine kinase